MTGEAVQRWDRATRLEPIRDWTRRRFDRKDLSWVASAFSPGASKDRYRRVPGRDGASQWAGLTLRLGMPEVILQAGHAAHRQGTPSALLGFDMLFTPIEYAIASRDAWWSLGTRRDVARLVFHSFGVDEVADDVTPAVREELLAWLEHYVPGRGVGPSVRKLLNLVSPRQARYCLRLPGESVARTIDLGQRRAPVHDALSTSEIQVVRPLNWYARRRGAASAAPGVGLRIAGGLVRGTTTAPSLLPNDAVVRLGAGGGTGIQPSTLRVLPPWTQIRYLPPQEPETP